MNEEKESVAVISVHGIADQLPGQTVRELARLLCHGLDGPPRYMQGELQDVLVPVAKLQPGSGSIRTLSCRKIFLAPQPLTKPLGVFATRPFHLATSSPPSCPGRE